MTDKVQKIREEVERLQNELIQEKEKGFGSDTDDACILELQNILTYIDSLQEEPVNEDFEEAANNALNNVLNTHEIINIRSCLEMFRFGAEWKEKEMQSTIELAEDHAMFAGMVKGKEEMIEKASVAFQVVCNCQAKLLPNCNKFCNRCEQFKQAIKDE